MVALDSNAYIAELERQVANLSLANIRLRTIISQYDGPVGSVDSDEGRGKESDEMPSGNPG
ncbi:MAG: hypothetical protein DWQ40_00375 [Actinobacteria bacterium]|nr:MAG: hypothetical protein DWQ40_00375 [Actinomycetota bacterium]REK35575.1 MAG: hypothetical protein DWQ20_06010 [Actinomycetota bacterium]